LLILDFLAAEKIAIVTSCILTVPFVLSAQSAPPPSAISAVSADPDAASPGASSLAMLPVAPTPSDPQNQTQQPAKPTQSSPPQTQSGTTPSLGDLGFTPAQTQANAQLQARLNQRTHDLKVHQTLGLITLAPLAATVIVAGGAKEKHDHHLPGSPLVGPSSSGVDLHVALGSTTVAMYAATAWYAIRAPKIPGVKPHGAIRMHRDLVWIHAPGMVLTPILGAMALNQENQGQKVHGIASAHSYVAWTTVGAYAASAVSISWPIHLKFWEK
jgi:hypothetical protein